jgi:hypothetical protein
MARAAHARLDGRDAGSRRHQNIDVEGAQSIGRLNFPKWRVPISSFPVY